MGAYTRRRRTRSERDPFSSSGQCCSYRLNRRWFLIIGHEECRWQRELVQFVNYIHFAKAQGHHTDLLEEEIARTRARERQRRVTWMNRWMCCEYPGFIKDSGVLARHRREPRLERILRRQSDHLYQIELCQSGWDVFSKSGSGQIFAVSDRTNRYGGSLSWRRGHHRRRRWCLAGPQPIEKGSIMEVVLAMFCRKTMM